MEFSLNSQIKPFSVELAKKGAKIRTTTGYPVRILCYDRESDYLDEKTYPIVSLVKYCGIERIEEHTLEGKSRRNSYDDLVIVEGEPEEWRTAYSVNKDPDFP